jgi:hypothetical protein
MAAWLEACGWMRVGGSTAPEQFHVGSVHRPAHRQRPRAREERRPLQRHVGPVGQSQVEQAVRQRQPVCARCGV